jgi:hypothetical protein
MVLVDTSVWVDHLRRGSPGLRDLLFAEKVLCHPFIIGELACGHLSERREILEDLRALPCSPFVAEDEVFAFLEAEGLYGKGLGWIDVQLLASARMGSSALWTVDGKLEAAARKVNLDYRRES